MLVSTKMYAAPEFWYGLPLSSTNAYQTFLNASPPSMVTKTKLNGSPRVKGILWSTSEYFPDQIVWSTSYSVSIVEVLFEFRNRHTDCEESYTEFSVSSNSFHGPDSVVSTSSTNRKSLEVLFE